MIRITQTDAIARMQAMLVELGAIPLDAKSGLIIITPDKFTECIEAARAGAVEQYRAEEDYANGPKN